MDLHNVDYTDAPHAPRSFWIRLRGAALVDATVYEEVEHDKTALVQAAVIVALAGVAREIGGASEYGILGGIVSDGLNWIVGGVIVWLIGVRVLGSSSDLLELLRVLGFASAPRLFFVLGALPLGAVRPVLLVAVVALGLLAWVIGTRQALDITTGRAVGVCVVAALPSIVVAVILEALLVSGL